MAAKVMAASVAELAAHIGKKGKLHLPTGMSVDVEVRDARQAFSRVDLLVAPIAGSGTSWVSAERVELEG